MVCFGLLNPHVVRLMLERSKFNGTVMPLTTPDVSAPLKAYKAAKNTKCRQTHALIFPDFPSLVSVVRSGHFDKDFGKIILCAAASKLEEHDLEPIDIVFKGTVWQTTRVIGSTVNQALAKSEIDDDLIATLIKSPERPEHQFSNHKKAVAAPTYQELIDKLGPKKTEASIQALLKFIVYGFVTTFASKAGDNASDLIKVCNKKLAAKNARAFTLHVKAKKIPMTKDAFEYAKSIQATPIASLILKYLWRRFIYNRPSSLAIAESACPSTFGAIAERLLTVKDIPVPQSQVRTKVAVPALNTSCTIVSVKPGMYSMPMVLKLVDYNATLDSLSKTETSIKFNIKPSWKNGEGWWPVTKTTPLLMLLNGRKFKFEGSGV